MIIKISHNRHGSTFVDINKKEIIHVSSIGVVFFSLGKTSIMSGGGCIKITCRTSTGKVTYEEASCRVSVLVDQHDRNECTSMSCGPDIWDKINHTVSATRNNAVSITAINHEFDDYGNTSNYLYYRPRVGGFKDFTDDIIDIVRGETNAMSKEVKLDVYLRCGFVL